MIQRSTLEKWQKKTAMQANHIKALQRKLDAKTDDLADIKAQRDMYRDFIRELCQIDRGEAGMDGTVRRVAERARQLMTPFKHRG